MDKMELRKAIQNCDIEIAEKIGFCAEELRNRKMTKEEADKAVAELRSKKADLEKQLAQMEAPQGGQEEKRSFAEVVKGAIEKRTAITLNGTGKVLSLSEVFKPAESKKPIAGLVSYFYGPNASTNIPVLGSAPAFTAVTEGGTFADGSPALAVKTVTPTGYGTSIGVSDYAMKLSSANLDSELRKSLVDGMANLVAKSIIDEADDQVTQTVTGGLTFAGLANLALAMKNKFDDGAIVMNSAVYTAIRATATGNEDKVYLEELIREKTIEGVKVIFSSDMPSATTSGSTLAIGGRWSDMAIGIADQLDITPKSAPASSLHYLDAICYVGAKCVVPANFWKLEA